MGRKERCPQCGSKKIAITGNLKKCEVCKHEWAGKTGRKTSKKEKTRF
jgi:rubredoxin